MVDFRPFGGLRYGGPAGNLGDLISPPYDVLTTEEVDELCARHERNVIRLEHPAVALRREAEPYQAAAALVGLWRSDGTLRRDGAPAFYVHEQQFEEDGQTKTRCVVYGRLRLRDWDEGEVLAHEYTMAGPKEDRLRLMSALRANVSPLYLLYDDPNSEVSSLLGRADEFGPIAEARGDGETHVLRALQDPVLVSSIEQQFRGRRLYMADGHHRYETALAFRSEVGGGGADFVLAGLTAGNDPGLSIHATHRLYSGEVEKDELRARLERDFVVTTTSRGELQDLLGGDEAVIGLAGLESRRSLHALCARDVSSLAAFVGTGPESWRQLDVNIVQHVILGSYLGLDPNQPNQRGLSYVHNVDEAITAVGRGDATLAVLVRAVTPRQLFEVSDSGARLPQKTTYFYPKLPTGLVMNLLD